MAAYHARVNCPLGVIVSSNMRSVDHVEINGLRARGFRACRRLAARGARRLARRHPCGEGSRALLAMALASAWPDDGRKMSVADAERSLSLCEGWKVQRCRRRPSGCATASPPMATWNRCSTRPATRRPPPTRSSTSAYGPSGFGGGRLMRQCCAVGRARRTRNLNAAPCRCARIIRAYRVAGSRRLLVLVDKHSRPSMS